MGHVNCDVMGHVTCDVMGHVTCDVMGHVTCEGDSGRAVLAGLTMRSV